MLYEFTKLRLSKNEFFNLVFMNAPPRWENKPEEHEFLLSLCGISLRDVLEKVKKESSYEGQSPTDIFKGINVVAKDEDNPWFQRHVEISQDFDKNRMGELWVRNLSNYDGGESEKCPGGSFYVEDGNHRALVYAMYIKCGKTKYSPVNARHATSWDIVSGILDFRPERAASLEHSGELQDKKRLQEKFQLPIGIQIRTYERD